MARKRLIAIVTLAAGILLIGVGLGIDILRNQPMEIGTLQLALILAGVLATVISFGLLFPRQFKLGWRGLLYLSFIPAALGLLLLLINVIGLGLNLRSSQASEGFSYGGKFRTAELSPTQASQQEGRLPNEANGDYARRLTDLYFRSVIHYWEEDGNADLRVPIWENWLLWATGQNPYEFCNPDKALQRGVGVCSQYSKMLVNTLQADGGFADVYPYVLEGHVVAQALIDMDAEGNETWWVLDSDYGVVLEHSVAYLQNHPEVVRQAYLDAGYDEDIAQNLADIYGPDGNYIEGNAGYCKEEAAAYQWKWPIPILLLMPAALLFAGDRALRRFLS